MYNIGNDRVVLKKQREFRTMSWADDARRKKHEMVGLDATLMYFSTALTPFEINYYRDQA